MSRADLMTALGLKNAEHFRKAYMTPALELKFFERAIPDKPSNRPEQLQVRAGGLVPRLILLSLPA